MGERSVWNVVSQTQRSPWLTKHQVFWHKACSDGYPSVDLSFPRLAGILVPTYYFIPMVTTWIAMLHDPHLLVIVQCSLCEKPTRLGLIFTIVKGQHKDRQYVLETMGTQETNIHVLRITCTLHKQNSSESALPSNSQLRSSRKFFTSRLYLRYTPSQSQ